METSLVTLTQRQALFLPLSCVSPNKNKIVMEFIVKRMEFFENYETTIRFGLPAKSLVMTQNLEDCPVPILFIFNLS